MTQTVAEWEKSIICSIKLLENLSRAGMTHDQYMEREKKLRDDLRQAFNNNPWKQHLEEKHVINHTLTAVHLVNPEKAINDLISYEVAMALDPKVSSDAAQLIARGRIEQAEVFYQAALPARKKAQLWAFNAIASGMLSAVLNTLGYYELAVPLIAVYVAASMTFLKWLYRP